LAAGIGEAKRREREVVEKKGRYFAAEEETGTDLKRYIVKETARRPLIMPVIFEV
jgi:Ribonuclease J C-terminal domain